MALVTVGIPFHDEEKLLEQAVRSVLDQTFDDLEILLIDDGSTDRSLAIARSFVDPRVQVISDGRRLLLAARLNEITRRARGDLIARMDADDVAHPERLARQLAVLHDQPSLDAVGTWIALVGDDDEPYAIVEAASFPATLEIALTRGLFAHATLLARRAWYQANPYDEMLPRAQDRDLWCRTARTSRFFVVPEPLYVVRTHARSGPFLHDYMEGQKQYRALVLRYGPEASGARGTARLWAASHAKAGIMRLAAAAGAADRIVRRRGRAPTEAERAIVHEAFARRT